MAVYSSMLSIAPICILLNAVFVVYVSLHLYYMVVAWIHATVLRVNYCSADIISGMASIIWLLFSLLFLSPSTAHMSNTAPLPRTASDLLASYNNYENYHKTKRISLRLLIPHMYTGQIIGSQGKIIQNISNYYHVFLQFSKCDSPRQFKRLLTIRGNAPDCAMACTFCFESLVSRYNDPVSSNTVWYAPPHVLTKPWDNNRCSTVSTLFCQIYSSSI